jgi:hypothetical protein
MTPRCTDRRRRTTGRERRAPVPAASCSRAVARQSTELTADTTGRADAPAPTRSLPVQTSPAHALARRLAAAVGALGPAGSGSYSGNPTAPQSPSKRRPPIQSLTAVPRISRPRCDHVGTHPGTASTSLSRLQPWRSALRHPFPSPPVHPPAGGPDMSLPLTLMSLPPSQPPLAARLPRLVPRTAAAQPDTPPSPPPTLPPVRTTVEAKFTYHPQPLSRSSSPAAAAAGPPQIKLVCGCDPPQRPLRLRRRHNIGRSRAVNGRTGVVHPPVDGSPPPPGGQTRTLLSRDAGTGARRWGRCTCRTAARCARSACGERACWGPPA